MEFICRKCKHSWTDHYSFLKDTEICFEGYQPHRDYSMAGLFLFTHRKEGCSTTLALLPEEVEMAIHQKVTDIIIVKRDQMICPANCFTIEQFTNCTREDCPGRFLKELSTTLKTKSF